MILGTVLLTGGVIAIANESDSDSSHTSVSSNDSLDVPVITITDVTVREGQGPAEVQVQLSEIQESDTTVEFSVISGTALPQSDYLLSEAEKDVSSHNLYEVFIPAGKSEAVITIDLIDDGFAEKNESFYVVLHESKDFDLEKSFIRVELKDDDLQNELTQVSPLSNIQKMKLGDIDNDGTKEIIILSNKNTGLASISYSDDDGIEVSTIDANKFGYALEVGDLNNDGLDDIFVGSGDKLILYQQGSSAESDFEVSSITLDNTIEGFNSSSISWTDIKLVDLTGDGYKDVLTANFYDSAMVVLVNPNDSGRSLDTWEISVIDAGDTSEVNGLRRSYVDTNDFNSDGVDEIYTIFTTFRDTPGAVLMYEYNLETRGFDYSALSQEGGGKGIAASADGMLYYDAGRTEDGQSQLVARKWSETNGSFSSEEILGTFNTLFINKIDAIALYDGAPLMIAAANWDNLALIDEEGVALIMEDYVTEESMIAFSANLRDFVVIESSPSEFSSIYFTAKSDGGVEGVYALHDINRDDDIAQYSSQMLDIDPSVPFPVVEVELSSDIDDEVQLNFLLNEAASQEVAIDYLVVQGEFSDSHVQAYAVGQLIFSKGEGNQVVEFDGEPFDLEQGVSVVLSQPQGLSFDDHIIAINEEDLL